MYMAIKTSRRTRYCHHPTERERERSGSATKIGNPAREVPCNSLRDKTRTHHLTLRVWVMLLQLSLFVLAESPPSSPQTAKEKGRIRSKR